MQPKRRGKVFVIDDRSAAAGAPLVELVRDVVAWIGDVRRERTLLLHGVVYALFDRRQAHFYVADVVEVHGELGLRLRTER